MKPGVARHPGCGADRFIVTNKLFSMDISWRRERGRVAPSAPEAPPPRIVARDHGEKAGATMRAA
jgi:hypothetical protein